MLETEGDQLFNSGKYEQAKLKYTEAYLLEERVELKQKILKSNENIETVRRYRLQRNKNKNLLIIGGSMATLLIFILLLSKPWRAPYDYSEEFIPYYPTEYDSSNGLNDESSSVTEVDQEGLDWSRALNENTRISFQEYLNKYPNGRYVGEASSKLNNLEDEQLTALRPNETSTSDLKKAITFFSQAKYSECKELLEQLTIKPNAEATTLLGSLYFYGYGVTRSNSHAIAHFEKAVLLGDVKANFFLGYCYQNGYGKGKDSRQASILCASSIDKIVAQTNMDNPYWTDILGTIYFHGCGVGKDFGKAFELYKKAALQGNALAQVNLGKMYEYWNEPPDYQEAVRWYRKAAEQGNPDGQLEIGFILDAGLHGVKEDDFEAVKWYRSAAIQGNDWAQNNLGLMYQHGRGGLTQDYSQAAKWYRKAIDQGNTNAHGHLGYLYEKGLGVEQDYERAAQLYRQAAVENYAFAQNNLGVLYEGGNGVPLDYSQAARWYEKAANQNYSTAQRNLGLCYENGRGVPQNTERAIELYKKAIENGYSKAQLDLDRVENLR